MDWIYVAQDREQNSEAFVKTVGTQVASYTGNLLSSCGTVHRGTVLSAVLHVRIWLSGSASLKLSLLRSFIRSLPGWLLGCCRISRKSAGGRVPAIVKVSCRHYDT